MGLLFKGAARVGTRLASRSGAARGMARTISSAVNKLSRGLNKIPIIGESISQMLLPIRKFTVRLSGHAKYFNKMRVKGFLPTAKNALSAIVNTPIKSAGKLLKAGAMAVIPGMIIKRLLGGSGGKEGKSGMAVPSDTPQFDPPADTPASQSPIDTSPMKESLSESKKTRDQDLESKIAEARALKQSTEEALAKVKQIRDDSPSQVERIYNKGKTTEDKLDILIDQINTQSRINLAQKNYQQGSFELDKARLQSENHRSNELYASLIRLQTKNASANNDLAKSVESVGSAVNQSTVKSAKMMNSAVSKVNAERKKSSLMKWALFAGIFAAANRIPGLMSNLGNLVSKGFESIPNALEPATRAIENLSQGIGTALSSIDQVGKGTKTNNELESITKSLASDLTPDSKGGITNDDVESTDDKAIPKSVNPAVAPRYTGETNLNDYGNYERPSKASMIFNSNIGEKLMWGGQKTYSFRTAEYNQLVKETASDLAKKEAKEAMAKGKAGGVYEASKKYYTNKYGESIDNLNDAGKSKLLKAENKAVRESLNKSKGLGLKDADYIKDQAVKAGDEAKRAAWASGKKLTNEGFEQVGKTLAEAGEVTESKTVNKFVFKPILNLIKRFAPGAVPKITPIFAKIATASAKMASKGIPIVGSLIGIVTNMVDVVRRAKKGDGLGAVISGIAAMANIIPFAGNYVSMAVDALNIYRDIQLEKETENLSAKIDRKLAENDELDKNHETIVKALDSHFGQDPKDSFSKRQKMEATNRLLDLQAKYQDKEGGLESEEFKAEANKIFKDLGIDSEYKDGKLVTKTQWDKMGLLKKVKSSMTSSSLKLYGINTTANGVSSTTLNKDLISVYSDVTDEGKRNWLSQGSMVNPFAHGGTGGRLLVQYKDKDDKEKKEYIKYAMRRGSKIVAPLGGKVVYTSNEGKGQVWIDDDMGYRWFIYGIKPKVSVGDIVEPRQTIGKVKNDTGYDPAIWVTVKSNKSGKTYNPFYLLSRERLDNLQSEMLNGGIKDTEQSELDMNQSQVDNSVDQPSDTNQTQVKDPSPTTSNPSSTISVDDSASSSNQPHPIKSYNELKSDKATLIKPSPRSLPQAPSLSSVPTIPSSAVMTSQPEKVSIAESIADTKGIVTDGDAIEQIDSDTDNEYTLNQDEVSKLIKSANIVNRSGKTISDKERLEFVTGQSGYCLGGTKMILDSIGLSLPTGRKGKSYGSAKHMTEEVLKSYGWKVIRTGNTKDLNDKLAKSTESLKPGDLWVMSPTPEKDNDDIDGHIAVFDGTNWRSDFMHTTINPSGINGKRFEDYSESKIFRPTLKSREIKTGYNAPYLGKRAGDLDAISLASSNRYKYGGSFNRASKDISNLTPVSNNTKGDGLGSATSTKDTTSNTNTTSGNTINSIGNNSNNTTNHYHTTNINNYTVNNALADELR